MSKTNAVSTKALYRRTIAVFFLAVVILATALVFAANTVPQQALADFELEVSAINTQSEGSASGSDASATASSGSQNELTTQSDDWGFPTRITFNTYYVDYNLKGKFTLNDSKYSDGTIGWELPLYANYVDVPTVYVVGVSSEATRLQVPEVIYLDSATKAEIERYVFGLLERYKGMVQNPEGEQMSSDVAGYYMRVFTTWLDGDWENKSYKPKLKSFSAGLPVERVDAMDNYQGEATYTSSSLKTLTFEETGADTSSWPKLQINGFKGLTNLSSITLPSARKHYLGSGCFSNTGIESIALTSSLQCVSFTRYSHNTADDGAFSNCHNLKTVDMSALATSLDRLMFCNCENLTTVTFGPNVTGVGDSAFEGCTGLTAVAFPNSLTKLGHDAFRGCTGLASVTWPSNKEFTTVDGFDSCIS